MTGESGDQIPARRTVRRFASSLQVEAPNENAMPTARIVDGTAVDDALSTRRRNLMRCGYAFMGVGLAIVKWPILIQNAASLPVTDGVVTAC
jgi:hypothetical protein